MEANDDNKNKMFQCWNINCKWVPLALDTEGITDILIEESKVALLDGTYFGAVDGLIEGAFDTQGLVDGLQMPQLKQGR